MLVDRLIQSVLILLAVTGQLVWSPWLGSAMPNIVLAILLSYCLNGDQTHSLWWAVIGGLLIDWQPGGWFGYHLLIYSALALVILNLSRTALQRPALPIAAMVFFVASLSYQGFTELIFGQLSWWLVLPALTTTLTALVAYAVLLYLVNKREVIRFG